MTPDALLSPKRKIRVSIIISSFAVEGPQGGAERFAIEMARRLEPRDFDLTLCGLWDHGLEHEEKWRAFLHEHGIQTVTTTPWTGDRWMDARRSLGFARRYFSDHPQDIINSHSAFSDVVAIWARAAGGARCLVRTLHSEREWYRHQMVGWVLNHLVFPWAFSVETGVSEKIAADLNRRPLARLLSRRARVMYNAIDWERFADLAVDVAAKRRSLDIPPDALVLGNVGRFTRQKGHVYLIEAMAQLVDRYPNCHLVLVGGGELLESMKERAAELGIRDQVHFLGVRTDVEEILPVMDVFVSSSLWEGLPTVILEAMAASVPVVCTAVSGSVELVKNGRTGIIVPPAKPTALVEAVSRLLDDRQGARTMAQNAFRYAQRFSIDEVADAYGRLFSSCANQGS